MSLKIDIGDRVLIIAFTAFIVVAIITRGFSRNVFKNTEIKIGAKYLRSYEWDTDNPFKKIEIDTILILDIKGGYVLYSYNSGGFIIQNSTRKRTLQPLIKPINYKR